MRKPRLIKVKSLAQVHPTGKCWPQDETQISLTPVGMSCPNSVLQITYWDVTLLQNEFCWCRLHFIRSLKQIKCFITRVIREWVTQSLSGFTLWNLIAHHLVVCLREEILSALLSDSLFTFIFLSFLKYAHVTCNLYILTIITYLFLKIDLVFPPFLCL